jgi:hypothetical protein
LELHPGQRALQLYGAVRLGRINLEIAALAPTILKLRSTAVFHYPDVPDQSRPLSASTLVRSIEMTQRFVKPPIAVLGRGGSVRRRNGLVGAGSRHPAADRVVANSAFNERRFWRKGLRMYSVPIRAEFSASAGLGLRIREITQESFPTDGVLEYASSGIGDTTPIPLGHLSLALRVPNDNDRELADQRQLNWQFDH